MAAPWTKGLRDEPGWGSARTALEKTSEFGLVCQNLYSPLHLIALLESEDIVKKVLTAMHLPAEVPELHPAAPAVPQSGRLRR
jgi:hypothetical protein